MPINHRISITVLHKNMILESLVHINIKIVISYIYCIYISNSNLKSKHKHISRIFLNFKNS